MNQRTTTRRPRSASARYWSSTAAAALVLASAVVVADGKKVPKQCSTDDFHKGVCKVHHDNEECGLYMAESVIPGAGWGMFSGIDRTGGDDVEETDPIEPFDLSIFVSDYEYQMEFDEKHKTIPEWLLKDYHWTSTVAQGDFDADHIYSITPGIGMLANSHPSLFNMRNDGCLTRERSPRNKETPQVGSYSHCQEHVFSPMYDIKAGDEIIVEYGDDWFADRENFLGPVPLSTDHEAVTDLLNTWEALTFDATSELAGDIWEMVVVTASKLMPESRRKAVPQTHEAALKASSEFFGSAAMDMPIRGRSIEYLKEHGMCLDHIETKPSEHVPDQRGAFASRNLKAGQIIAPVPLVHISRKHLEVRISDEEQHEVWWMGQQLLLNYCYGHKDSSLLLFPYSPGVNLVNHAGGLMKYDDEFNDSEMPKPNVALRWSDKANKTMLEESVDTLLRKDHSGGLIMDLYALRDIEEGEELFLDYGPSFEEKFHKHYDNWQPPVHADDYKSAWEFEVNPEIYTLDEPKEYPPSYIQTRCWIDVKRLEKSDEDDDGWFDFVRPESIFVDATVPCHVVQAEYGHDGEKESFRVHVPPEAGSWATKVRQGKIKVKNVPWDAITFAEKPYTGNQFLRQSFRHEIHLPDDVFPKAWMDLRSPEDEKCGLYMAPSAIPNSGFGVYAARPVTKMERIFSGDVVIQIEDYTENQYLRKLYHNITISEEEEDGWLLDNYYWNAEVTHGSYESDKVSSIVPGLGMLANSHPGLVNAEIQAPERIANLNRLKDVGAGASTYYHDVYFYTPQGIEAGEEVFVKYGDNWFIDRVDLGMIPLENDFIRADSLVNRFVHISTSKSLPDELAKDMWGLVEIATASQKRLANALPKDVSEIPVVATTGSAKYSTPDRLRTPEWLEKNGVCLDNIKPGDSTVKQAGKGAIATRQIKKGSVIAPMPVVQILRKDLEVYESKTESKGGAPLVRFLGYSLLMNYCYSHPLSSIMLFPYSPVTNYLNHNSTSFNAKLRWSSMNKKEWLSRTPEDLAKEEHAGLVMEIVATREIKEGEEVFISYGSAWEKAWQEHSIDWFPDDSEDYVPAAALNQKVEWIRTEKELKEKPYPENVMTVCFVGDRLKSRTKSKEFRWAYFDGIYDYIEFSRPCTIIQREDGVDLLDAYDRSDSILPVDVRYTALIDNEGGQIVVTNIPRQAIQFFDKPYTSDLFNRKAFRHEIHMPDDMVPRVWRDLKK